MEYTDAVLQCQNGQESEYSLKEKSRGTWGEKRYINEIETNAMAGTQF